MGSPDWLMMLLGKDLEYSQEIIFTGNKVDVSVE